MNESYKIPGNEGLKVENLESLILAQIALMKKQLEALSVAKDLPESEGEAEDEKIKHHVTETIGGIEEKKKVVMKASTPPELGARLGKDADGNAAWFVADPENQGEFVQL